MPAPRDGLGTIRGLRARCRELRSILEDSPELCTPEEVAAYWPGGAQNPHGKTRAGWTYCYGQLAGFVRRLEVGSAQDDRIREQAEAAARDALRGAPEYVTLDAIDPATATPKQLAVFPKSFHALCVIRDSDDLIGRMLPVYQELRRGGTKLYAAHGDEVLARITHYHRLIAWILAHPEPGLPYPDSEVSPTPPAWTADLSPRDIVVIMRANQFVNGARAALAMRLIDGDPTTGERSASWKTLLALAAKEQGVSSRTIARDYTLESVVAQMAEAREAERRAAPPSERPGRPMPEMVG